MESEEADGVVAQFTSDGACWLIYHASLTRAENSKLANAVAVEGRRRLKAGGSDAVRVRERAADDVIVGELKRVA